MGTAIVRAMRGSSVRCAITLLCLLALVAQSGYAAEVTDVKKSDTSVDPPAAKLVAAVRQVVRSELAKQPKSAAAEPSSSKSAAERPGDLLFGKKVEKKISNDECSAARCYPADHKKCSKFTCSVATEKRQPAISAGGMVTLTQHRGATLKLSRKFVMRFNFKIIGANYAFLWGVNGKSALVMAYNPHCRCMVVEVSTRDNRGHDRLFRLMTDATLVLKRWYTAAVVVDLDATSVISVYFNGARQTENRGAGLVYYNNQTLGIKLVRFSKPGAGDIRGNRWHITTNFRYGRHPQYPGKIVQIEDWRYYDNLGALERILAPPQDQTNSRTGCKWPLMYVLANPKTRTGWCVSPGLYPQNYCYTVGGLDACTKTSLVQSFGYLYGGTIMKRKRHRWLPQFIGSTYKAVLILLKTTVCSKFPNETLLSEARGGSMKVISPNKCSVVKKVGCYVYVGDERHFKRDMSGGKGTIFWILRYGSSHLKYSAYAKIFAGIKDGTTVTCSDFKLSQKRIKYGKMASFTPADMKKGWLGDSR